MPKTMLSALCDGMTVNTLACLKQKKLLPYKNKPGAFLALTLTDRTGSLEGKIFDNAETLAPQLAEGTIVNINGRASLYQGVLGLVLDSAVPWDGPVEFADFMPSYPGDVAVLEARLDELLASIRDAELSLLLQSLFGDPDIREKYCLAPAAMYVHGAYLHGLLEHVIRQAELAEAACRCYPQVWRDLLIAGVLLHDIGKIHEFNWGVTIEYSTLGRLLGHAVIGDRLVSERGWELGICEETALRLRHLILSHHGTHEFGAVVLPQTLEAIILHSVDNLEAKAAHCIDFIGHTDPAAPWTEKDRLEGHAWYRGDDSALTGDSSR